MNYIIYLIIIFLFYYDALNGSDASFSMKKSAGEFFLNYQKYNRNDLQK